MKKVLFTTFVVLLAFTASVFAQEDKSKRPSPPATATGTVGDATITINYSQPAVKGRNVWAGDFAPYGKVWRTGANESTSFETSKDIKIEGKSLAAGKYALFTIPGEKEWVIILNKKIAWGAYSYKESEDVLRVTVPALKAAQMNERFTIAVANNKVSLMWENAQVDVKLQ